MTLSVFRLMRLFCVVVNMQVEHNLGLETYLFFGQGNPLIANDRQRSVSMPCRIVVVHNCLLVTTVDKVEVGFLRHRLQFQTTLHGALKS